MIRKKKRGKYEGAEPVLILAVKIYPPRAMSSSVHLRSGLVWTRHLNTAPGDFTEVLYLESAFGAPTRTLHIKKKWHSVTIQ